MAIATQLAMDYISFFRYNKKFMDQAQINIIRFVTIKPSFLLSLFKPPGNYELSA